MPGPPDPDREILRIRYQVGSRIRDLRLAGHLSQERLAELCGLDRKTISRAENGTYALSIDQCVRIARGLGVPLVSLFSGV